MTTNRSHCSSFVIVLFRLINMVPNHYHEITVRCTPLCAKALLFTNPSLLDNPYRDSNRVEYTEVDRTNSKLYSSHMHLCARQPLHKYSWLDLSEKGKSTYSSSQDRTDYVVSEQARALSAKRARLASDLSDEERPSYSHRGASQSQRLKPPPASLNIDAFTLSSNTFDNRKLRADLERAKRWIKQAEESFEELANIRYTEAEKNLETLREKYEDRFECELWSFRITLDSFYHYFAYAILNCSFWKTHQVFTTYPTSAWSQSWFHARGADSTTRAGRDFKKGECRTAGTV